MKILVTGSNGFVGKHLIELLKSTTADEIIGLDREDADITDYKSIKKFFNKIFADQIYPHDQKDFGVGVYHLAGFASGAGKDKNLIFKVNVTGTENILKAIQDNQKSNTPGVLQSVKILLASTAYVYGDTDVCADEKYRIDAKSFYDQSKIEMEKISRKYLSDNIQIVITRATNHSGPGQKPGFVIADFCKAIAKAKSGDTITVGNLEAKRDFFDVRDCVRAYKIVMERGVSGEIYNIGRGEPVSIKNILKKLIKISKKNISYKIDPEKIRPSDISQNFVDASKIKALGWKPEIELEKTFKDTYEYYLTLE